MKSESTSLRLKQLMTQRNLRQVDILEMAKPYSEKYGTKLSKADLSQYVSGKVLPGQDKLSLLAMALKVSETWLMGYDVPQSLETSPSIPSGFIPMPEMVRVPLLGKIACGTPLLAEENIDDYIDIPRGRKVDFCLLCSGDSMIDAGIHDGDIVFIHHQPDVENGEIAAVRIGSEATLKRVYKQDGYITLIAENKKYPPYIFREGHPEDITIVGKAVGFQHWY